MSRNNDIQKTRDQLETEKLRNFLPSDYQEEFMTPPFVKDGVVTFLCQNRKHLNRVKLEIYYSVQQSGIGHSICWRCFSDCESAKDGIYSEKIRIHRD